ncbi:non-ribosomal peptide synthetase-like protein [Propionicimonas paludicola]|uniref:Non-ribosomal peptide synthetase-like protein n=1 Tax=Propionicimonas paludicola TaxID=185243 RepID=A0A2A9CRN3_9ACTN|nr:hypothetical protein [Propionicimonas paludicola]PFG17107.1 non-ribosomal peptide synthetase-like protein [Propionicimonas paludicola]
MSGDPVAPALPRLAFTLTGIAQLSVLLLATAAVGTVLAWGFSWITAAENLAFGYLTALQWTALVLAGWQLISVIGKWLLVGRVRPGRIRMWSFRHFRFWVATTLVRSAPAARLVGSEWQRWHLNSTGARIGRGTVLLCSTPPVPDLLDIGPNCFVGERTLVAGYRPAPGALLLDRTRMGAGAVVGDDCVLEPGSALGDHARLADSASLQPGQQVPSGQSWHGSPARPVDTELPNLPQLITQPRVSQRVRQVGYAWLQLVAWIAGLAAVATAVSWLGRFLLVELLSAAADGSAFGLPLTLAWSLALSGAALVLALLAAFVMTALPRAVAALSEDSRVFPLPGGRWSLVRLVRAWSNLSWPNALFSSSVLAARRLRLLGWRLRQRPGGFEAFGELIGQDNPSAITWGAGSVAGDRVWIANIECAADAFRVHPARIGTDCSIGDQVTWPSAARLGDSCEVAARTAVPVSGPIRIRTSLIGSPAVETDRPASERTEWGRSLPELYRQLADRARSDLTTTGLQLLVSWIWITLALTGVQALTATALPGWLISSLLIVGVALIRWSCWLIAEAIARSAIPARPVTFAIRDLRFSRHHRARRLGLEPPALLSGTALRPLWWRLRGAQVGRCVFDDGAVLSEPRLAQIGDQTMLGQGAALQSHETKNAAYTLAEITLGERTVLGNRSLLLAGTQLGADSQVAADAVLFAQLGAPGSSWLGNPATQIVPATSVDQPSNQPPAAQPSARPARSRGEDHSRPARPRKQRTPKPTSAEKPIPTEKPVAVAKAPAARTKKTKRPKATPPAVAPAALVAEAPLPTLEPVPSSPPTPAEEFTLLGTSFSAERIMVPRLSATVAVFDLSPTPLMDLNLPQALTGFGIPEECLEDDLSLRDAPISPSAEIRSLLARILLRQLLSTAHPEHRPDEWGFIRSSGGGLSPFWPTVDASVSLGRADAVVVAAIAAGPIGVAVRAETAEPGLEPSAAQWLSPDEWTRLTASPRAAANASLTRMAAVKNAALKAISEWGPAAPTELDALAAADAVRWRSPGRSERWLPSAAWPIVAGGVRHWVAVVGPVGSWFEQDEAQEVSQNGWH